VTADADLPDAHGPDELTAIGPVQLLVLDLDSSTGYAVVLEELGALRAAGLARVIDALAVFKDDDGAVEVEHLTNLTPGEAAEFGARVGGLIAAPDGSEASGTTRLHTAGTGTHVLGTAQEQSVIEELTPGRAAALILLEHHWAVPLRDALIRAGGLRSSSGLLTPLDVVEIGMQSLEETVDLTAGDAVPEGRLTRSPSRVLSG
jgi:hypothetical protein